jgi:hypothetical protein
MKKSAFMFLRSTYFRWARKIGALCPELTDAPQVLSVGDMHLENFGTWRDADGRFVWGVNDFDEAAVMPYPLDLVRLAASTRLAPDLAVGNRDAAAALLQGYLEGLAQPQPALLDEGEIRLRPYAIGVGQGPGNFWNEVGGYPKAVPPSKVTRALTHSLPKGVTNIRFCSRVAGGGSLGRPRYVAIADWHGGRVLREAKASVPSAWIWAHGGKSQASNFLNWRTANFAPRTRFSTCATTSSCAASPPIRRRSNSAATPAQNSGPTCCKPWDSISHRSMPQVPRASAPCNTI